MNNESSHAYVPLSEDIFNNGDGEHNNNNNFESFLLRPQMSNERTFSRRRRRTRRPRTTRSHLGKPATSDGGKHHHEHLELHARASFNAGSF